MLEFPFRCSNCHRESMVDLESLEIRPIDQVMSAEGYICPYCESWEPVFFSTVSLRDKLGKLENMKPEHSKYRYHFSTLLNKATRFQARIRRRDGPSKNKDVATS